MAAPPFPAEFRKSDFPSNGLGSPEALEKFFLQLNSSLKGTRNALSGALTLGDNMNAEVKTVTVTTPSSGMFPNGAPYASYTSATSQTFASGSTAVFNFETKEFDSDGAVTLGSGWKFTVPSGKGGLYRVSACVTVNATTAVGQLILVLEKNGSPYRRLVRLYTSTTQETAMHGAIDVNLAAGDYVQLAVFQNSGGSATTEALAMTNWVTVACSQLTSPVVMSCFPLSVTTKVSKPVGVALVNCQDNASGATTPALGWLSYTLTGTGALNITNIPGLNLGRTYALTLLILGG